MKLSIALGAVVSVLALFACGASEDDNSATGDDQNIEEVPCRPVDDVVCHKGEHTISTAACGPGLARCLPDGCELPSLFQCSGGYVTTTASCRGKTARCVAPDAGNDAPTDASHKG